MKSKRAECKDCIHPQDLKKTTSDHSAENTATSDDSAEKDYMNYIRPHHMK